MQIVASIYAPSADNAGVTAFTERVAAGAFLGYVLRDGADMLYVTDGDSLTPYGDAEYVCPTLRMRTRATIVARRYFEGRLVVA